MCDINVSQSHNAGLYLASPATIMNKKYKLKHKICIEICSRRLNYPWFFNYQDNVMYKSIYIHLNHVIICPSMIIF